MSKPIKSLWQPITYESLVVENTNRCNAKCDMCYQSSGPKGSDDRGIANLEVDTLKKVIREAIQISTLGKRFHLAGGEAFLAFDNCLALFSEARDAGYEVISATTNGYWARDLDTARVRCQQLAQAGLNHIELSWDFWHLPYISPIALSHCIIACSEQGIYTHLRTLTTKRHLAGEVLRLISPEALSVVDKVSSGTVSPTGRAETKVPADEIYSYPATLGENCHEVLNLTVNALGQVAPCCAGADQTDALSFGNVKETSIVDIEQNMQSSLLLRTLVFQGIGSMVPILEEKGIAVRDQEFSSICHLCWKIFSDPERAQILKDYFEELEQKTFQEMLQKHVGVA